jgi:hypothetical protein
MNVTFILLVFSAMRKEVRELYEYYEIYPCVDMAAVGVLVFDRMINFVLGESKCKL